MNRLDGDEGALEEIQELWKQIDGLGAEIRVIIYRILNKQPNYIIKKKELYVRVISASQRPIQTHAINFHLQKMSSAGLLEIRGDIVKLLKRVDIRIDNIE